MILIASCSMVYAELSFLNTAANELYSKSQPPFANMTPLACTYTVYQKPTNSNNGWTINDIVRVFYLDDKNSNVYTEDKEPVSIVNDYNDSEIKFTVSVIENKSTTIRHYRIDRYSGRVYVDGYTRHKYGALASLTYNNLDFSGKGFCEAGAKGKKF